MCVFAFSPPFKPARAVANTFLVSSQGGVSSQCVTACGPSRQLKIRPTKSRGKFEQTSRSTFSHDVFSGRWVRDAFHLTQLRGTFDFLIFVKKPRRNDRKTSWFEDVVRPRQKKRSRLITHHLSWKVVFTAWRYRASNTDWSQLETHTQSHNGVNIASLYLCTKCAVSCSPIAPIFGLRASADQANPANQFDCLFRQTRLLVFVCAGDRISGILNRDNGITNRKDDATARRFYFALSAPSFLPNS